MSILLGLSVGLNVVLLAFAVFQHVVIKAAGEAIGIRI